MNVRRDTKAGTGLEIIIEMRASENKPFYLSTFGAHWSHGAGAGFYLALPLKEARELRDELTRLLGLEPEDLGETSR